MRHEIAWTARQRRTARQRMDRARRLFIWLCRETIETKPDGCWIVAEAMVKHRLYYSSTGRSGRQFAFSVLRAYWRCLGSPGEWWRWIEFNGWDVKTVTRSQEFIDRFGRHAKTQDVCTPRRSRT